MEMTWRRAVFKSKKDPADDSFEFDNRNQGDSAFQRKTERPADAEGRKIVQEIMSSRIKPVYSIADGDGSRNADESVPGGGSGNMTVGPGVKMEGAIRHFEKLMILGASEGELEGENLIIGEGGWLKGSATIRNMEVVGQFEGIAVVAGHVHLRATGVIDGTITYSSIEIENGGQISGEMRPAKKTLAGAKAGEQPASHGGGSLATLPVQFPDMAPSEEDKSDA
jgi:cytoskeletal protein CcmA (bactofilin family)